MVLPLNEGLFCVMKTDPVEEEGGKKCSEENKIVAKEGDIFIPFPVVAPVEWKSTITITKFQQKGVVFLSFPGVLENGDQQ